MHFLEPGRTAAVFLGASGWPHYKNLNGGESFRRSAEGMKNYLLSRSGLSLSIRLDVLDLFDSDLSSQGQIDALSLFLRNWHHGSPDSERLTGLVIFYVGHGSFSSTTRDFCLLLRSSRPGNELSSLPVRALADQLKNDAPFIRQLVVLDCCFSGAAHRTWMDPQPANFAARTTVQAMPANGTVLLCSSAETMPSMAPKNADKTMFTGALLHALDEGSPDLLGDLSPRNARDLAFQFMQEKWSDEAVRPVVYAVDRGNGDLSDFPVFRNPAVYAPGKATRSVGGDGTGNNLDGTQRPPGLLELVKLQALQGALMIRRAIWRGGIWSNVSYSLFLTLSLLSSSAELRQYLTGFLPFDWQECYIRDAATGDLDPHQPRRQCVANRVTYIKWKDKSDAYLCTKLADRRCPNDRPNRSIALLQVDDRGRLMWGESMLNYIEFGKEVWSTPTANWTELPSGELSILLRRINRDSDKCSPEELAAKSSRRMQYETRRTGGVDQMRLWWELVDCNDLPFGRGHPVVLNRAEHSDLCEGEESRICVGPISRQLGDFRIPWRIVVAFSVFLALGNLAIRGARKVR